MHFLYLLFPFLALVGIAYAKPSSVERYAGTQVVRVPTGNSTQSTSINSIISRFGLVTWASASVTRQFVDIVVPPTLSKRFSAELSRLDIPVTIMHADLGESILKESKSHTLKGVRERAFDGDWFSAYHPFSDHMRYIDELAAAFPKNARIFTIGISAEDRPLTGINIFGSEGPDTKPAVVFFGGIHGRDWISTMVPEYLSERLLNDRTYLEEFDFYIVPIVNPDGFEYSRTTDRMWRKGRSRDMNELCSGRDLDRNFPFKWEDSIGASTQHCSDTFKGLAAADTPEVKAMVDFLTSKGLSSVGAPLFINFQSYGNEFLSPYAWTESSVPYNNDQILSMARGYAAAIRPRFDTKVVEGTFSSILYPAGGTAVDFAFEVAKIPYSYVHVLRDTGRYGYILPADQIVPTGLETYDGVRYLLDTLSTTMQK
ncbi:hypothetical protein BDZ94DRAFT_1308458 [Collybia nuda]|uniref:Peptidase M14 domain-containing protein n=1 Tax=Collybia nuda TaxID=64659 RepID=A0A9P5Y7L2_9AGAR|nr:hypothetical protein BDZ94DRAFT_1308458 [Collybia nuda]